MRVNAGLSGLAAALALATFGLAAAPPARAQTAVALPATDEGRIDELVIANHILADQGVVDGFGHISVRSAKNPKHFFMARAVAPAQVTRADILEFDENSQPVAANGPTPYGERFIHGEIFRARPDVQAVVHSHTPAVIPFGVTQAPLKALIHVAYFLGTDPAPVFDLRQVEGDNNLMLVATNKAGAGLAKTLGHRSVVLMRGHGMAVVGPTIRDAVFRAIYTQLNAQVELEALRLGPPAFMNRFEVTRTEAVTRNWDLWAAQSAASHGGR